MTHAQVYPGSELAIDVDVEVDTDTSTSPTYSFGAWLPLAGTGLTPLGVDLTQLPTGTSASDFDVTVTASGTGKGMRVKCKTNTALAANSKLRCRFRTRVSNSAPPLTDMAILPVALACPVPSCTTPAQFDPTGDPVKFVTVIPTVVSLLRGTQPAHRLAHGASVAQRGWQRWALHRVYVGARACRFHAWRHERRARGPRGRARRDTR